MYQIYYCLGRQHDHRLVLLAAAICVLSVFTQVRLLRSLTDRREPWRSVWIAITAFVTAIGVWATHFVAMLAFDPGLPLEYDPGETAGSLIAAIVLMFAGLYLACQRRWRWAPAGGNSLVGLAIGVMHYMGMAAVRVPGDFLWRPATILASIVIGVGFCVAAAEVYVRGRGLKHDVGAILLMTLAICSLHFLGMGAFTILPDPAQPIPPEAISRGVLAAAVAGTSVVILLGAITVTIIERRQSKANDLRLSELANAAVEGLAVCQDDRITTVNAALARLLNTPPQALVGRAFQSLIAPGQAAFTPSAAEDGVVLETAVQLDDGQVIPVELAARALPFNGATRMGIGVRDLRPRRAAEARIRFLAHNDPLTGLANRASFSERLRDAVQGYQWKGEAFAVLCLDLDRFKQVNDVFGQNVGDDILRAVAARIEPLLSPGDTLARLDGDEFAVLRLGAKGGAQISRLADDVLAALAAEGELGAGAPKVGASLGVALFPDNAADAETLMRCAASALYQAKADGRGVVRFFDADLGAALRQRQELEFDLRQAVALGQLRMVYQPQVDISTGRTFGFEALVRWDHPRRGAVSPGEFIPLAEETGLILEIGDWVLAEACREAAGWGEPLQVAVNVSGVQLRTAGLAGRVHQTLLETGLSPRRLELEITETAMVDDLQQALHSLRQVKALGVKVAMDDFGTGYSSLSNLRAFPFDKLKIDQSFVRNAAGNEETGAILRAIIGLAKGLKLQVLAEGVESAEDVAFLTQEGCTQAQGYFFGRPDRVASLAAPANVEPAPSPSHRRCG